MASTTDDTQLRWNQNAGKRSKGSYGLKRNVSALHDERTITLTGSFSCLDVCEGDTLGSDSLPVDIVLVGRKVNTLGLSSFLGVPNRLDGDGEGCGGERKCRRDLHS